MTDRALVTAGTWAIAADGLQWTLCRQKTHRGGWYWHPVSFVHSSKDILARCMREKGVALDTARLLLAGLPDSFDEWKTHQSSPQGALAPILAGAEEAAE